MEFYKMMMDGSPSVLAMDKDLEAGNQEDHVNREL